jgi:hypothetical protein
MQSQLEHIDQWRKMSRDDAINVFQVRSAAFGDGDNAQNPAAALPPLAGPESPAGSAANAQALQPVYLSNVLVYPHADPPENKDYHRKNVAEAGNEATTVTPEQEEWRCYGTTEVDLLVLRPDTREVNDGEKNVPDQEEEEIAAVAPYTAPGMAVRDLTANAFGKERTRTIRLGILEIVYSTGMEPDEVEDHDDVVDRAQTPPGKTPPTPGGKKKKRTADDDDDKERVSTPVRIYQSAQKVAAHMEQNAKLLYESTQDSFPERTMDAGKRIYEEFGKTIHRTVGMMKKMANLFGDDDDDGNGPKRK